MCPNSRRPCRPRKISGSRSDAGWKRIGNRLPPASRASACKKQGPTRSRSNSMDKTNEVIEDLLDRFSGTSEPASGPMAEAVKVILEQVGEDPSRNGLEDTPVRVAKAWRFLTSGYRMDMQDILNGALFEVCYDEMVIVRDIELFSLCEHHLLPFYGKAHVA